MRRRLLCFLLGAALPVALYFFVFFILPNIGSPMCQDQHSYEILSPGKTWKATVFLHGCDAGLGISWGYKGVLLAPASQPDRSTTVYTNGDIFSPDLQITWLDDSRLRIVNAAAQGTSSPAQATSVASTIIEVAHLHPLHPML